MQIQYYQYLMIQMFLYPRNLLCHRMGFSYYIGFTLLPNKK